MTTQNMLSSLMASPIDVRRAQAAKTQQDAMNLANADPYAASKYMMGMAGAGFAAPLAGTLGMQNAEEVEARAIQNIQTQIDHSSSEGLMKGVEALNQAGNPKLAQLYYEAALKARDVEIASQNANTRVDELNQKAPTTINTENEQGSKLTRQWNPKTRTWDVVDIGQSNAAREEERRFNPYTGGKYRFDANNMTDEQRKMVDFFGKQVMNGDRSSLDSGGANPELKRAILESSARQSLERDKSPEEFTKSTMDTIGRQKAINHYNNVNAIEMQKITAFSTALHHLGSFAHSVKKLDNGQIQLFNWAGNKIDAYLGKPAPTNAEAIAKVLAKEVTRSFTGPMSGVAERQAMLDTLSNVKSPEQLEGAIREIKELMVGQLNTSRNTYTALTGRGVDEFNNLLSKDALNVVSRINDEVAAREVPALPTGQQVDRRSEYEAWKAQQGMK